MVARERGFRLVEGASPSSRLLLSPEGIQIAVLAKPVGRTIPIVAPSVAGLDCAGEFRSEAQMVDEIAKRYVRLTTPTWRRWVAPVWHAVRASWKGLTAAVMLVAAGATILKACGAL